jgi:hypothetical protein
VVAEMRIDGVDVVAQSIETSGPESLMATGVTITDEFEPHHIEIESIRISALDIDGIRENGVLGYFDFEFAGVNFMSLARAAAAEAHFPLGDAGLPESTLASFAARVMPVDGATDIGVDLGIDDLVNFTLGVVMSGNVDGVLDLHQAPIERLEVSLTDDGFVVALIDAIVDIIGMTGDDLLAMYDAGMVDAPFPITEDDPRGSVFYAGRELLANRETGGTLRISVIPAVPMMLDDLGAVFEQPEFNGATMNIDAQFTPN